MKALVRALVVLAPLLIAPAVAFADATYGPDDCYDEAAATTSVRLHPACRIPAST